MGSSSSSSYSTGVPPAWFCKTWGLFMGSCPPPPPPWQNYGQEWTPELADAYNEAAATCGVTQDALNTYRNNISSDPNQIQDQVVNVGTQLNLYKAPQSSAPNMVLVSNGISVGTFQANAANCTQATYMILNQSHNDCSNPNTLVDASGMQTCNLINGSNGETARVNMCTTQYNASTAVLNSINPAFARPQLVGAQAANSKLQTLAQTSYLNPNYQYTLQDINNYNQTGVNTCYTTFDDCSNNSTLISQAGIQTCLSQEFNNAQNTCNYALNLATQSNDTTGGMQKIPQIWGDASNSILGNTISNNKTILLNAANECTQWVQMYDVWQEDEEQASELPCVPERPIEPSYNPAIQNIVEKWSEAASAYLKSLIARLQVIEQYTQNYPDILQLNQSYVQALPPGQPPYFSIRRVVNTDTPTISPIFQLHIDVPMGAPGPQGKPGKKGPKGIKGAVGKTGLAGKPGKWEIPVQYKLT